MWSKIYYVCTLSRVNSGHYSAVVLLDNRDVLKTSCTEVRNVILSAQRGADV